MLNIRLCAREIVRDSPRGVRISPIGRKLAKICNKSAAIFSLPIDSARRLHSAPAFDAFFCNFRMETRLASTAKRGLFGHRRVCFETGYLIISDAVSPCAFLDRYDVRWRNSAITKETPPPHPPTHPPPISVWGVLSLYSRFLLMDTALSGDG